MAREEGWRKMWRKGMARRVFTLPVCDTSAMALRCKCHGNQPRTGQGKGKMREEEKGKGEGKLGEAQDSFYSTPKAKVCPNTCDLALNLTWYKSTTHTKYSPNLHNAIKWNTNHQLGNWGWRKNLTTDTLNVQAHNNTQGSSKHQTDRIGLTACYLVRANNKLHVKHQADRLGFTHASTQS